MPHFIATNHNLIFPFTEGDYTFHAEFVHQDFKDQSLIFTTFKHEPFFIIKTTHKNGTLFKAHKATKPNPIGILKDALMLLNKHCDTHSHNLSKNTPKQCILSPYFLKSSDFICKDFDSYFLEIGFGSGRHILNLAKENPTTPIIGVEIHTPSIEQVLRQIEILGLNNLYITKLDARILTNILKSNSAKGIFLHFPVPWNKKPHRRVLTKEFLHQALRILKPDHILHLRTDDEEYFQDALKLALDEKQCHFKVQKNLTQKVVSKYEARWLRQQKNIYDIYYTSLKIDSTLEFNENFSFPYTYITKIQKQKHIENDFFVHINAIYTNNNCILINVNLGDFNWPTTKFILIDHQKKQTFFVGNPPLPTLCNIKAYQKLKAILGG